MKISVLALIYSDDNEKILLVKRRDVPVWVIPGGCVEPGEQLESACLREAFEETKLEVGILKKIAFFLPVNRLTSQTHLFACKIKKGVPAATDEAEEARFFPIGNLPKDLFFVHKDMVGLAQRHTGEAQTLYFDQVTYFGLAKYMFCHPVRLIRFILSQAGFPINSKIYPNNLKI